MSRNADMIIARDEYLDLINTINNQKKAIEVLRPFFLAEKERRNIPEKPPELTSEQEEAIKKFEDEFDALPKNITSTSSVQFKNLVGDLRNAFEKKDDPLIESSTRRLQKLLNEIQGVISKVVIINWIKNPNDPNDYKPLSRKSQIQQVLDDTDLLKIDSKTVFTNEKARSHFQTSNLFRYFEDIVITSESIMIGNEFNDIYKEDLYKPIKIKQIYDIQEEIKKPPSGNNDENEKSEPNSGGETSAVAEEAVLKGETDPASEPTTEGVAVAAGESSSENVDATLFEGTERPFLDALGMTLDKNNQVISTKMNTDNSDIFVFGPSGTGKSMTNLKVKALLKHFDENIRIETTYNYHYIDLKNQTVSSPEINDSIAHFTPFNPNSTRSVDCTTYTFGNKSVNPGKTVKFWDMPGSENPYDLFQMFLPLRTPTDSNKKLLPIKFVVFLIQTIPYTSENEKKLKELIVAKVDRTTVSSAKLKTYDILTTRDVVSFNFNVALDDEGFTTDKQGMLGTLNYAKIFEYMTTIYGFVIPEKTNADQKKISRAKFFAENFAKYLIYVKDRLLESFYIQSLIFTTINATKVAQRQKLDGEGYKENSWTEGMIRIPIQTDVNWKESLKSILAALFPSFNDTKASFEKYAGKKVDPESISNHFLGSKGAYKALEFNPQPFVFVQKTTDTNDREIQKPYTDIYNIPSRIYESTMKRKSRATLVMTVYVPPKLPDAGEKIDETDVVMNTYVRKHNMTKQSIKTFMNALAKDPFDKRKSLWNYILRECMKRLASTEMPQPENVEQLMFPLYYQFVNIFREVVGTLIPSEANSVDTLVLPKELVNLLVEKVPAQYQDCIYDKIDVDKALSSVSLPEENMIFLFKESMDSDSKNAIKWFSNNCFLCKNQKSRCDNVYMMLFPTEVSNAEGIDTKAIMYKIILLFVHHNYEDRLQQEDGSLDFGTFSAVAMRRVAALLHSLESGKAFA